VIVKHGVKKGDGIRGRQTVAGVFGGKMLKYYELLLKYDVALEMKL
jgi:hypothetical protein